MKSLLTLVLGLVSLLPGGDGTALTRPDASAAHAVARDRVTAADVIAKAGRPTAGAMSDGGRVLLAWTAGYGGQFDREWLTAYRVMDGDRVVSERLLFRRPAEDVSASVEAMPGGFVVVDFNGRARFVSVSGGTTALAFDWKTVRLLPGDQAVGIEGWLYRPSTRTVYIGVRAPGGSVAAHVDGQGSWWSLGVIEDGQQVLWSRAPGGRWVKHLVGAQEPYTPQCTCPWGPSIQGRGPVVVASMGPLNHVSLDHGATWRTLDLADSEPFQAVYDYLREPHTSALPDGRIVTGYFQLWVADDATNTTFREVGYRSLTAWQAGLSRQPVRRGHTVSVDGGLTWTPLDPQPSGAPSQHGTM